MKYIISIAVCLLLSTQHLRGQNIPTANWAGPWGVQVNTWNGNLFFDRTDLAIPNQGIPLECAFFYNGFRDTLDLGYGKGWTFSYGFRYLQPSADTVVLERPDGRTDVFVWSGGAFKNPKGIFDRLEAYQPGRLRLTTKSGMRYFFDNAVHKRLTKIEDPNGNALSITYNNGVPVILTDPAGRNVVLSWANGRLSSITDNNTSPGRSIKYTYTNNRLTTVTDPEGGIVRYVYSSNGLLEKIENERGDILTVKYTASGAVEEVFTCLAHARFSYNPAQRKTFVVEKNQSGDQMTTYAYDENGRLLSKSGSCCGFNTAYQYDTDNNLGQLTDANGNKLAANHDVNGNALVVTDPLAAQQSFTYEPNFNRLSTLKDKKGNQTQMQYDASGNLTSIQMPEAVSIAMSYAAKGRLASMTDGKGQAIQFSYNAQNEVTAVQYPIGSESYQYDGVGNLTTSTDGNGNPVHFEYDRLNRLRSVRDPLSHTVRFEYDAASNLTREIDANTNEKTYEYDAHNRLATVSTPAGTTRYAYDAQDNLVAITDANGHTTRFGYDARNLLVEETDPLGNKTTYTHDGNGNVLTKTDPNGQTTNYAYDALNRLIRKSYLGNTDNYTYDANGNLTHCSNKNVSIRLTYDGLNRLKGKTIENWGKSVQYAYDKNGNRTSMTDPDGGVTTYEYDANDRLTRITSPSGQARFLYDTGGRITELQHHNGSRIRYTYDAANRLVTLLNRRDDNSVIADFSYTYDANGNRLTENLQPAGIFSDYGYDGDNRLVSVNSPAAGLNDIFSFDSTGNRASLVRNGAATTYTYDAGDRLQQAGAAVFQYDPNGNQTQRNDFSGETRYEFDGENRLVRVVTSAGTDVRFQYDPFGNRISRTINGVETRYFLDGDNVLLELNAAGITQARYTSALTLDSWLILQRGSQSYYYHTDALGSVVALTDNAQFVVQTYRYDAYGNITAATGNVPNPYRYTGREFDSATGLYYYRTRYYDAREGRFLTRDGFIGEPNRPISMNRYNYAESNPITYTDPDGKYVFLIGAVRLGLDAYKWYKRLSTGKAWINFTKAVYSNYRGETCTDLLPLLSDILLGKSGEEGVYKTAADILSNILDGLTTTDWFEKYLKVPKHEKKIKNALKKFVLRQAYDYIQGEAKAHGIKVELRLFCDDKKFNDDGTPIKGVQDAKPPLDSLQSGDGNIPKPDISIPIVRSIDPNEIIAPPGVGAARWVSASATLPYTILFENDPDFATAPAQRVVIEHILDADLNPYSFRLGAFGFGSWYVEVPDNVSYYSTRIDLRDTFGIWLDVLASIDANQRRAFWIFESIDPASGLAASLPAETGFLPVNDTTSHNGEGFVNFTVRAGIAAKTGSPIDAQANITFDNNPPIATNIAFNTLDADAPKSGIVMIDTIGGGAYKLHWSGTDIGSGLESYTLHVSANNGPFLPVAGPFTDTMYTYSGHPDSTYRFFTIARDSVGNVELPKYTGEPSCMAVTIVTLVDAPVGSTNGSATLSVSGNNGALTFTWSHNPSLNGPVATGLAPGNYTVFVEDAGGCKVAVSFTIKAFVGTVSASTEPVIYRIFPVPTTGLVQVEFSTHQKTAYIQVFNTAGRMVLQQNVQSGASEKMLVSLDLSGHAAGSYIVRILGPSGSVNGVVIKQ